MFSVVSKRISQATHLYNTSCSYSMPLWEHVRHRRRKCINDVLHVKFVFRLQENYIAPCFRKSRKFRFWYHFCNASLFWYDTRPSVASCSKGKVFLYKNIYQNRISNIARFNVNEIVCKNLILTELRLKK